MEFTNQELELLEIALIRLKNNYKDNIADNHEEINYILEKNLLDELDYVDELQESNTELETEIELIKSLLNKLKTR